MTEFPSIVSVIKDIVRNSAQMLHVARSKTIQTIMLA